jgi:hypothetical protein
MGVPIVPGILVRDHWSMLLGIEPVGAAEGRAYLVVQDFDGAKCYFLVRVLYDA